MQHESHTLIVPSCKHFYTHFPEGNFLLLQFKLMEANANFSRHSHRPQSPNPDNNIALSSECVHFPECKCQWCGFPPQLQTKGISCCCWWWGWRKWKIYWEITSSLVRLTVLVCVFSGWLHHLRCMFYSMEYLEVQTVVVTPRTSFLCVVILVGKWVVFFLWQRLNIKC